MVNKCCAINCRSGYTGENKDPDVTFHSFPLHDNSCFKIGLNVLQEKILPQLSIQGCIHFTSNLKIF